MSVCLTAGVGNVTRRFPIQPPIEVEGKKAAARAETGVNDFLPTAEAARVLGRDSSYSACSHCLNLPSQPSSRHQAIYIANCSESNALCKLSSLGYQEHLAEAREKSARPPICFF